MLPTLSVESEVKLLFLQTYLFLQAPPYSLLHQPYTGNLYLPSYHIPHTLPLHPGFLLESVVEKPRNVTTSGCNIPYIDTFL